ncbi:MAG: hypothetical protein AMK71_04820 [Nitrospira bacterium SG8_35_4]|nr:MAG: hypothetical protein AMK71_04820 [Nitrospira bacterium SG8_35_4]
MTAMIYKNNCEQTAKGVQFFGEGQLRAGKEPTIMDKIIITADLGHFKAYKVTETPSGKWKIDMIESYDSIEGHGKLGEKLSDTAGRFEGGGRAGEITKGYGQPHNLELEIQKKLARMIAQDINVLIEREDYTAWCLASPKKINGIIVKNLKPDVKTAMIKNITADLTKVKKSDLPGHFASI